MTILPSISMNFKKKGKIKKIGAQKVKLYKIKYFIFDFGGVLVEQSYTDKNILDIIEHDLELKIPRDYNSFTKKLNRRMKSGLISSREYLEKILDKYYYPNQQKNRILTPKKVNIDYYLELWIQMYSLLTNFSYEMEKIIERLHQAGYEVILLSNTFDIHANSNELKGFYNVFNKLFLSNEIGLIKPDIEKYKYMLKKLDTKGKYCVFIDNKLRNLVPARKLGMVVLKFESIANFNKYLTQLGIKELKKGLRKEIKEKYKNYKKIKMNFKKIKKEYKKAKNEYKKKKKFRSIKKKYKRIKNQYKKEKENIKELKTEIPPFKKKIRIFFNFLFSDKSFFLISLDNYLNKIVSQF